MIEEDYSMFCDFLTFYCAHQAARRCKTTKKPIVKFDLEQGINLQKLVEQMENGTYKVKGYQSFYVYQPKKRQIQALRYEDRIVQHVLCDNFLMPYFSKRVIYDNSACQQGKGHHFALRRITQFLHKYYNNYGADGYVLKCDILKFFPSIPHTIVKKMVGDHIRDEKVKKLFFDIIDSYQTTKGFMKKYGIRYTEPVYTKHGWVPKPITRGVPIGNQTSQIIGMIYLDKVDRLVKEKLGIKYYSRYMDDFILIHPSKEYLRECLEKIRYVVEKELKLQFNNKTQIFPLKNGFQYLGFNFYLKSNGKVIKNVKKATKLRFKSRIRFLNKFYPLQKIDQTTAISVLASYHGHLKNSTNGKAVERQMKKRLKVDVTKPVCDKDPLDIIYGDDELDKLYEKLEKMKKND